MTDACDHLDQVTHAAPSADGCGDCMTMGGTWLHLRRCAACGHIGCCDSSPNRHATAHANASTHPVVQSFEPGEDWLWCYVDEVGFEMESMTPSPSHP